MSLPVCHWLLGCYIKKEKTIYHFAIIYRTDFFLIAETWAVKKKRRAQGRTRAGNSDELSDTGQARAWASRARTRLGPKFEARAGLYREVRAVAFGTNTYRASATPSTDTPANAMTQVWKRNTEQRRQFSCLNVKSFLFLHLLITLEWYYYYYYCYWVYRVCWFCCSKHYCCCCCCRKINIPVLFKIEFYSNPVLNVFIFWNDNDYKNGIVKYNSEDEKISISLF